VWDINLQDPHHYDDAIIISDESSEDNENSWFPEEDESGVEDPNVLVPTGRKSIRSELRGGGNEYHHRRDFLKRLGAIVLSNSALGKVRFGQLPLKSIQSEIAPINVLPDFITNAILNPALWIPEARKAIKNLEASIVTEKDPEKIELAKQQIQSWQESTIQAKANAPAYIRLLEDEARHFSAVIQYFRPLLRYMEQYGLEALEYELENGLSKNITPDDYEMVSTVVKDSEEELRQGGAAAAGKRETSEVVEVRCRLHGNGPRVEVLHNHVANSSAGLARKL
jgi:hypothetical protein